MIKLNDHTSKSKLNKKKNPMPIVQRRLKGKQNLAEPKANLLDFGPHPQESRAGVSCWLDFCFAFFSFSLNPFVSCILIQLVLLLFIVLGRILRFKICFERAKNNMDKKNRGSIINIIWTRGKFRIFSQEKLIIEIFKVLFVTLKYLYYI